MAGAQAGASGRNCGGLLLSGFLVFVQTLTEEILPRIHLSDAALLLTTDDSWAPDNWH